MAEPLPNKPAGDGINRRGFLKYMAWVGTGLVWTVGGGILGCQRVGEPDPAGTSAESAPAPAGTPARARAAGFSFVQISDSHIGFSREPNRNVTATLEEAVRRINALPQRPDFLLHTGDLTHLARPGEFDTVDQVLRTARAGEVFYVPGEHDVAADGGRAYRARYGRGTRGQGWRSFDHRGVHFIGLVNVLDLRPGGLGSLGREQLDWMRRDVANLADSTPVVVYAHVPLWTVSRQWGWGTEDGAQALALLRRFGSVTVLNGHIHQTLQRVEGRVTFHTARSTAFPQPAPGTAPSPGPMRGVPPGRLRSLLGITTVRYAGGSDALAITDPTLA
jgi:3',5'-cyclic AMP phosphodiesterase CpdA